MTMTSTTTERISGDLINVATIRVTKKDEKRAERDARAHALAVRAAAIADARRNVTESEQVFASGNLADYYDIGCDIVALIDHGHARGVRSVAIAAEHTPEEWQAMEADARARGVKAQPRRLSVYKRAHDIARLIENGDEAPLLIDDFVSTTDKYGPEAFVSWLKGSTTTERDPLAVLAAAMRSAARKGVTIAQMVALAECGGDI